MFFLYLSLSAVKNIEWFTYYMMLKKVFHNWFLYPTLFSHLSLRSLRTNYVFSLAFLVSSVLILYNV
jgi:hypothetical protein